MANSNVKYTWDEYVKYLIGIVLILFCTYILIGDITFLIFKKSAYTQNMQFNDKTNTLSFEYYNEHKKHKVTITDVALKENTYNAIKNQSQAEFFYNPYFSEEVYFDSESFPKIGTLILFCFGIVIIYILMRHKW